MGVYEKKPVRINAEKVSDVIEGCKNGWKDLPEWVRNACLDRRITFRHEVIIVEKMLVGTANDMLLKLKNDKLTICKLDLFNDTYLEVKEQKGKKSAKNK